MHIVNYSKNLLFKKYAEAINDVSKIVQKP